MKFNKFRRYSFYLPALMLVFFLFSFVHSELGLFDFDHGAHAEHDHCEIVQATNLPATGFRVAQTKLEVNKHLTLSITIPDGFPVPGTSVSAYNNLEPASRAPLPHYIHHCSLLI